jgi:hypothetical protein
VRPFVAVCFLQTSAEVAGLGVPQNRAAKSRCAMRTFLSSIPQFDELQIRGRLFVFAFH